MGTVEEVESWLQFDPNGFFIAVDEDGKHSFILLSIFTLKTI